MLRTFIILLICMSFMAAVNCDGYESLELGMDRSRRRWVDPRHMMFKMYLQCLRNNSDEPKCLQAYKTMGGEDQFRKM
ncbi:DgyrCDS13318 [Dimorphilus gyrociliatus]|uniref:DgyrCDS13318 n=1 Tax=Dimorphilus gyrociliatus TaxID=2664684 RepID=A0A7I8WAB3_9ANNE|nr:DgyrCDS13318 [Dimorphilus gyrociliatus]